jgi:hypothetical protein
MHAITALLEGLAALGAYLAVGIGWSFVAARLGWMTRGGWMESDRSDARLTYGWQVVAGLHILLWPVMAPPCIVIFLVRMAMQGVKRVDAGKYSAALWEQHVRYVDARHERVQAEYARQRAIQETNHLLSTPKLLSSNSRDDGPSWDGNIYR